MCWPHVTSHPWSSPHFLYFGDPTGAPNLLKKDMLKTLPTISFPFYLPRATCSDSRGRPDPNKQTWWHCREGTGRHFGAGHPLTQPHKWPPLSLPSEWESCLRRQQERSWDLLLPREPKCDQTQPAQAISSYYRCISNVLITGSTFLLSTWGICTTTHHTLGHRKNPKKLHTGEMLNSTLITVQEN